MAKFKVGDKVTRKVCTESRAFSRVLEHREYYTVTDVQNLEGAGLQWLQVDGYCLNLHDPCPWLGDNFELYVEPEEELPPAPKSVYYPDMFTVMTGLKAAGGTAGITVRQSPYQDDAVSVSVDGSKWSRLDADAALQLAHDLRRMAMHIKRKEKA